MSSRADLDEIKRRFIEALDNPSPEMEAKLAEQWAEAIDRREVSE